MQKAWFSGAAEGLALNFVLFLGKKVRFVEKNVSDGVENSCRGARNTLLRQFRLVVFVCNSHKKCRISATER